MKLRTWLQGFVWAAVVLGVASAGCEDRGSAIAVEFARDTQPQRLFQGLVITPGLDVLDLRIAVREIKVLPDRTADPTADKYKAKGSYVLDLLDREGVVVPPVDLNAGVYKKVELKIEKGDDGDGLDGEGAALFLEGDLDGTPFVFRLEKLDKITLRHQEGIDLRAGVTETFIVDLGVTRWFDGVDAGALETDADGLVVIDAKGANKAAYQTMADNVGAALKLVRKPQ